MATGPADLLRQRGIQVTAQRLAVLRAVSSELHITADAVAEAVRAEIGAISPVGIRRSQRTGHRGPDPPHSARGITRALRGSRRRQPSSSDLSSLRARRRHRPSAKALFTAHDDSGYQIDEAEVGTGTVSGLPRRIQVNSACLVRLKATLQPTYPPVDTIRQARWRQSYQGIARKSTSRFHQRSRKKSPGRSNRAALQSLLEVNAHGRRKQVPILGDIAQRSIQSRLVAESAEPERPTHNHPVIRWATSLITQKSSNRSISRP